MTPVACPPCGLRFEPSTLRLCPECEHPLVTLRCAEDAVGLRLFTAPDVSLPALAAAIQALPERQPPAPA
jgi:hypothetical protein